MPEAVIASTSYSLIFKPELVNMKKIILLAFVLLIHIRVSAQDGPPPKISNASFKKGTYYLLKKPSVAHASGVVVMLPGLTDAIYSPLFQSALADSLIKKGYIVMIPILTDDNMHLAISDDDMKNLGLMLSDLITKQFVNRRSSPIILGGMSVGGTTAIRFYQRYKEKIVEGNFNITCVYAVDPPLDLERLYNSLEKMHDDAMLTILKEPYSNTKSLNEQLKACSPLSYVGTTTAAFDYTKLRMYCEPDIQWYLNHKMEVTDMNVVDCSAYYRQLKQNQANKVELILTNDRGYRQPGNIRHPHSWSIIDVGDFLKWIE